MFLVVFLRANLIPFVNLVPWVEGSQWEIAEFTANWFVIDLLVGHLFSVGSWVAIVDQMLNTCDILDVSFHILGALHYSPLWISVLKEIICVSHGRWV